MTHLFNWKEWLSFVSVFRFQVSSHERNCKNNTGQNLPRTMEILRIYTCKHGHNDHLPCQLLPSVKTDFGQILWHA